MFLLVPAYPGCPGSKAVKRLLLLLSGTTRVSWYQTGKTHLDFTEARDSEWQWHQLGHIQVCTSLQTDNHASTPPLSFLQAGCPSCRPTNSVKALKACTLSPYLDKIKICWILDLLCQLYDATVSIPQRTGQQHLLLLPPCESFAASIPLRLQV